MKKIGDSIVAFLPLESIEAAALQQIKNTASMAFLYRHVAVMPDTHYGKGSTVGTVLPTKGAIIPAAVGVDIGCGMIAVLTNIAAHDILPKLNELRLGIERRIPMSAGKFNNKITLSAKDRIAKLEETPGAAMADELSKNWRYQLGTLGGGNHFIELCLDEDRAVWATLHSGSRGVGNRIGTSYIKKAQELCEKQSIQLPDRDLAYLVEGTSQFDNYIRDMQ
jgi:tRNA-splicing ligase RtcB (3'-phosphate/5'-hydroxy nucleic acid ligase)